MFKFKRGEYLRDKVTGFTGAVIARQDHLTGCNSYYLQPSAGKRGHIDGHWYDENALQYDPARLGQKIELDDSQPPG